MAIAVAAAGAASGGYLGGLLAESIGNQQLKAVNGTVIAPGVYTKGGPGLSSKEKAMNAVAMVDPGQANLMLQQGAQTFQNWANQGLNFYGQSINVAANEVLLGYGQANATLQPISQAGNVALNQYMRMLGLPGTTTATGFANQLNALGSVAGANTSQLQAQMVAADKLTDPAARLDAMVNIVGGLQGLQVDSSKQQQRAALGATPTVQSLEQIYNALPSSQKYGANPNSKGVPQGTMSWDQLNSLLSDPRIDATTKQTIQSQIQQVQSVQQQQQQALDQYTQQSQKIDTITSPTANNLQQQLAALGPRPSVSNTLKPYYDPGLGMEVDPSVPVGQAKLPKGATQQDYIQSQNSQLQQQQAQQAQEQATWDSKAQQILLQNVPQNVQDNQLQQLLNNFVTSYSLDNTAPYTGEQISQQLAATPGYQFQLDQGIQAITRQKAATGMLMSGNTGVALVEYGQGLAQNTYNQYMANLAGIANMGSQATGQIAANQVNQGQDLAQLATGYGGAVAGTYNQIGASAQQAANLQSQNLLQSSMYNASAYNSRGRAALNSQTALAQQQIASAPGMLNAATNASANQYAMYKGNAAANAFSGGGMLPTGYWQQPSGMTQSQLNAANMSV